MRRRPSLPLAVAVAGALGILLEYLLVFHTGHGHSLDQRVSGGFTALYHRPVLHQIAVVVPHLSDPRPFALWFLIIVGVALYRGRARTAVAATAVLLAANLTTALLKPVTVAPRFTQMEHHSPDVWPSGHATASMAVALCAILVASQRWRPFLAAAGLVYTLAVTLSLLVGGWHFPSDVVAGYLMAGTWFALAVAALWALEARRPTAERPQRRLRLVEALAPAAAVAAVGMALGVVVALDRPSAVTDYARAHTAFVVGTAVICVLAFALVAVVSAALTSTRTARATAAGSDPAPTGAHGHPPRPARG